MNLPQQPKNPNITMRNKSIIAIALIASCLAAPAQTNPTAQTTDATPGNSAETAVPVLQIDAGTIKGNVSPTLYGLMTEEINFSYEGGIYGELIRNRTFKSSAQSPTFWN